MEVKYFLLVFVTTITFMLHVDGVVVTVGTPVVYTNNNGGGADEIRAPNGGLATMQFCIGGKITNAWYQAYDNINDLSGIGTIDVVPSGSGVQLIVKGYVNPRDARVRIKIFAEVEVPCH